MSESVGPLFQVTKTNARRVPGLAAQRSPQPDNLGGSFRSSPAGRRVLIWQGNGEITFRENLDLVEQATGLPVDRARDT